MDDYDYRAARLLICGFLAIMVLFVGGGLALEWMNKQALMHEYAAASLQCEHGLIE